MKNTSPKETRFVINQWSGQTHYECAACAYDTFEYDELMLHLVNKHNDEAALETLLKLEAETTVPAQNVAEIPSDDTPEIFEVELREISSESDEDGVAQKKFTIKE